MLPVLNGEQMKSTLTIAGLFCLALSASAQYHIDSIQVPGGGSPSSFCSFAGGWPSTSVTASFSGTELNAAMTGKGLSEMSAWSSFIGTVQGSVYWTVTYTGASAPPDDAPVTLEFNSGYILNSSLNAVANFAELSGDPVFGPLYDSGTANENNSGSLSEVYTTVGTWVLESPGVWQGNTGYYSVNVGGECGSAPTPPSPANSSGVHWTFNVKVTEINGAAVTGG
jgi:hypothetical protein